MKTFFDTLCDFYETKKQESYYCTNTCGLDQGDPIYSKIIEKRLNEQYCHSIILCILYYDYMD